MAEKHDGLAHSGGPTTDQPIASAPLNTAATEARSDEKTIPHELATNSAPFDVEQNTSVSGASWMYRPIGPLKIWYASPAVQLILVSLVCFLCPGMFNAINGMGAGGQVNATASNNANTALYSTFSVVGFFAGSIVNRVGIKISLAFGGIGYCVYVASFLCYNFTANYGFVIFAGAFLGVCAGCLWAAQGAIMMSYPSEGNKGKYISWFWGIFNLGGVIGSLIPLGQNINNQGGVVTNGTYVGFIVLMFCGAMLAWSLCNADNVVRRDGSKVILMKHPTWQTEIYGLWEVLLSDWYIVLLFPMFFASNFFYTYQFNDINLAKFTTRTRALNNLLYWGAQIVGALVFGYALDINRFSRRTRARGAIAALLALTMVIWGGGYAFQRTYTRDPRALSTNPAFLAQVEASKMDWTTRGYVGPMFLYIFYGFFDAAWQTSTYYLMGSLTNNSRKLANFAGFYKGIQSAGGAVAAAIDNYHPPYMNELAGNWGLLVGGLLFAAPVVWWKIRDHVPLEEDLKFSDESVGDVKGSDF